MSLVSVIISDLFEKYLPETLANLNETADGPIEIIVKTDDNSLGMRHCLNRAAEEAKGEFLFKLDGHCIMSPHWDTIMKDTCGENDMVVSRIKPITERTWKIVEDRGFDFVTVNPDLSIIECGNFVQDDPDVAETMASIGCGFMVRKNRFMELEMNWEQLGRYGNLGVEWALKIWLSGGRLLVNRGVTCGHLFRKQGVTGCGAREQAWARQLLGIRFQKMEGPKQTHTICWLAEHFNKIKQECST